MFGQNTYGIDCGQEASDWLSQFLEKPGMRLLHFDSEMTKRLTSGGYLSKLLPAETFPEEAQASKNSPRCSAGSLHGVFPCACLVCLTDVAERPPHHMIT